MSVRLADPKATPFLADMEARGLLNQKTPELTDAYITEHRPAMYVGFDPSAPSLHAGNLMPLLGMDRYRQRGGQVVVLLGGATGLIGDPSGKDAERNLQTEDVVEANIEGQRKQFERLFALTDGPEPIYVNNADWWRKMDVVSFLRDVGKHFSVNAMLTKDSVRNRIENRDQGISFTEFSYQLLQGYDFVHLHRTHNVQIQMGGSDQWGNIVGGVDLMRRIEGVQAHAVTYPLLTNSEGKKYGKSEKGAVWIDPDLTSPYEFYQFWLNSADADAPKFLSWLTDVDLGQLEELTQAEPHLRLPQKALAELLTARVHGQKAADLAIEASTVIFKGKSDNLSVELIDMIARAVPTLDAPAGEELKLIDAMVDESVQAAASKGEARRLLKQNSVSLNGQKVQDENADVREHRTGAGAVVMSVGKTKRFLIRFNG
ncbi:MAG: tyrosine--tRNA ligase [Oceanicaulis sp.]|uniref:tyrosine--tRNA ligase n=1 Tax=unclassified Oceanicaulis TaxID=2632123 RepID=UPI000C5F3D3A|nr:MULTISPECIES: tyrosine--tRNA ligase [unclassified Oceanicaulis]MAB69442.1 tyrosine--tRNA ligase [Oceanicaulis sp.]MBC39051.1 tyrosine--tRNA ligase [Oceanicaulis sp.]MBG37032.1 tyrosine--tRNA ligase [Oceanicaulis sp.]HBU61922.1 tyrosine--tRNA ligase [Oceanicaulis sp.]HCR93465.1 tyrosine--tRNA ligase [Oceanicaulis sp.]|tara:strand:+ start:911 stop:2200 length:1290 start_codon:yes stop_codon:yes gene_type:complete